jgi:hypothetical protein
MAFATKKSASRGFGDAMPAETAASLVDEWNDSETNVSLIFGPNRKRAGSKARARYAIYSSASTLLEYMELTGGVDDWAGRADLIYDLSKGLVDYELPNGDK